MIVYNEDDIPGTRVEPYDEKYVKQLEAENAKLRKENEELRKYIAEGGPQK